MSISTFDELKEAIANFAERGDLTTQMENFISLAEARLNRSLHHPNMEHRATATVATTAEEPEFVDLPVGFQSMRRLYLPGVTGAPTIDYLTEGQLSKGRILRGDSSGQPTNYTIFGTELELFPTPDADYTLEMVSPRI